MNTSSVEGLAAAGNLIDQRAVRWADFPDGDGPPGAVFCIADPYWFEGTYPNGVRFAWPDQGKEEYASFEFAFWTTPECVSGAFVQVETDPNNFMEIPDARSGAAPPIIYKDGFTRVIAGTITNGQRSILLDRRIDTSYLLSDVSGTSAGRICFAITEASGVFAASVYGPRAYTAFSFAASSFAGLPQLLTRTYVGPSSKMPSIVGVFTPRHDLGGFDVAATDGKALFPINETNNFFSGNFTGAGGNAAYFAKPTGSERSRSRFGYLATAANTPAPPQRKLAEVVPFAVYPSAGLRTFPYGQSATESRSIRVTVDLPAFPYFYDTSTLAAVGAFPSVSLECEIPSHENSIGLGTSLFAVSDAPGNTVQLTQYDDNEAAFAPLPLGVQMPGEGGLGIKTVQVIGGLVPVGTPVVGESFFAVPIQLPPWEEISGTVPFNSQQTQDAYESVRQSKTEELSRLLIDIADANSGIPMVRDPFPDVYGACVKRTHPNGAFVSFSLWPRDLRKRTQHSVTFPDKAACHIDLVPRLYATTESVTPSGYEQFTSEAVRGGEQSAVKYYYTGFGALSFSFWYSTFNKFQQARSYFQENFQPLLQQGTVNRRFAVMLPTGQSFPSSFLFGLDDVPHAFAGYDRYSPGSNTRGLNPLTCELSESRQSGQGNSLVSSPPVVANIGTPSIPLQVVQDLFSAGQTTWQTTVTTSLPFAGSSTYPATITMQLA